MSVPDDHTFMACACGEVFEADSWMEAIELMAEHERQVHPKDLPHDPSLNDDGC